MPGNRHVRCGGRPRETDRAKSRNRALGRSHNPTSNKIYAALGYQPVVDMANLVTVR